jgi:hypothetical protein
MVATECGVTLALDAISQWRADLPAAFPSYDLLERLRPSHRPHGGAGDAVAYLGDTLGCLSPAHGQIIPTGQDTLRTPQ